jgi:hypothetical protein
MLRGRTRWKIYARWGPVRTNPITHITQISTYMRPEGPKNEGSHNDLDLFTNDHSYDYCVFLFAYSVPQ